jgi:hypothetical protein
VAVSYKFVRTSAIELLLVAAAIGLIVLVAIPPGPSARAVQDAKLFCSSIGPITAMAEVLERASAIKDKVVRVDMVDQHKVLVRIGLCHCWATFAESGTKTTEVVCNG